MNNGIMDEIINFGNDLNEFDNGYNDTNQPQQQSNSSSRIDVIKIKIFATKKMNIKPQNVNSVDGQSEFLNEVPPSNLIHSQHLSNYEIPNINHQTPITSNFSK